jgi:hypothetical protein
MDQGIIDRIAVAAPFLATKEAQAARPYLQESLQLALDILEYIDDNWQSSQAIADWVLSAKKREVNRETVTQTLRSLKDAFNLESSNKGWRRKG